MPGCPLIYRRIIILISPLFGRLLTKIIKKIKITGTLHSGNGFYAMMKANLLAEEGNEIIRYNGVFDPNKSLYVYRSGVLYAAGATA